MLRPKLITLGGVLFGALLVPPATALGQQPGAPGGKAGAQRDTMLSREADIQNRNTQLELLSEPNKVKVLTTEDRKFIANQIFEDFERVQIINREMMQATSKLDDNSYKRISSLADEMNKRAKRLKTNLNIPDLEQNEKKPDSKAEMDAAQLKVSVLSLNVSVKSFCLSPVFTNPKVTTVGHLQNLRKDISDVIDMSRTVKKAASKLQN